MIQSRNNIVQNESITLERNQYMEKYSYEIIFDIINIFFRCCPSEICELEEYHNIYGNHELLDVTDTKEECSIAVHTQYPKATGVTWSERDNWCYANFGNSLSYDTNSQHLWSCILNGKK